MHIQLACDQFHLSFRKVRVDEDQRQAVKSQIPCGIPGIFPFIGHGDDIEVVQMFPVVVAPGMARRGGWRRSRVTRKPLFDVVVVELLGPQHSCQSLALYVLFIRSQIRILDCGVKGVSFF